jgi:hypothetical protein
MKNIYIATAAIIGLLIMGIGSYEILERTPGPVDDSAHITLYLSDVISAIKSYDDSTREADKVAKQYAAEAINTGNKDVKTAEEKAILMQDINDFQAGNASLASFLNDANPVIKLTSQSISQSASSMLKPDEDMLQVFDGGDTQMMQNALASETAA